MKKGVTGINVNTTMIDSQTSFLGLGNDKSSVNDEYQEGTTP